MINPKRLHHKKKKKKTGMFTIVVKFNGFDTVSYFTVLTVAAKVLGWYVNLPLTYNGKNENWHLLLSRRRYFDKNIRNVP